MMEADRLEDYGDVEAYFAARIQARKEEHRGRAEPPQQRPGLEEGREAGREAGRAEGHVVGQRESLRRHAAMKFDSETAARLGAVLEGVTDQAAFDGVLAALIECDTPSELLARATARRGGARTGATSTPRAIAEFVPAGRQAPPLSPRAVYGRQSSLTPARAEHPRRTASAPKLGARIELLAHSPKLGVQIELAADPPGALPALLVVGHHAGREREHLSRADRHSSGSGDGGSPACRPSCSRTRRRKSASPVHASAAAIRASPESPLKSSRSFVKSRAVSTPRARSAAATSSMRSCACPSRRPCTCPSRRPRACPSRRPHMPLPKTSRMSDRHARTLALSERVSGLCSGVVPSRAPIASAVRSSARHTGSDIGASVSAR